MAYIELKQGEIISKGNFSFVFDSTKNEGIYNKFLEAEQIFKINYIDFSHKIRMAYEAFALFEEVQRRKQLPEYVGKSEADIEAAIVREITTPSSILNYKNIIIGLCKDRTTEFESVFTKYEYNKNIQNDSENRRVMKKFIRYIYDFGSKSSHINNKIDAQYIPNRENCLKVIVSFHDFLAIYYGVGHKFDSTLIPIRTYIPVPKKICEEMGLNLGVGKRLYVRENKGKIMYSIFSSDIDDISFSQKRDIETINKLWEDNFDDPSNIIRLSENISGSNGDYKYQVYSLPGRPLKISQLLLHELTVDEKLDIIKGICRGIESMHEYEPPFYHRNICPDSFYIFKIKGKYKALLARFDCTKDTAYDAKYTVINTVEKKILNDNTKVYFAPEVINSDVGTNINWEKTDIYSLAQVCIYLLSGKISVDSQESLENLDESDIDDDIKYIILKMISKNPKERPSIKEILDIIN
ncbi:serine/threonine protein kinase [Clostridium pasteurianum DSM 525 = ATCC 6013]|uniref:Protein kinase n=1 Tax=Clostridium pasteurianum DSM 525 = ATCC 6013 TaxID=1262449 RepID=A0A0H3J7J1_CLOPA|nr:serine/threonine protein kinase [Clostridium pasteurianum]AJA49157.1 serine/threonine protein kinase [Clostridium pasteurianum DSM 525 = ATCC 6013]AJA53145.1 serine/threonine protein kinase [Clostridium pasteurianum DSM 525 = ATCC 6013]AOZ76343.1 serine/threonine protein kinase [Clostridium pasteurianum DSM 525 = ATCC 6013]AOZ80140.1 serine/threonine protein kinase [Clostridium pasteurianum]ELP59091.1 serine/threonine protein kinase [Clostridium pasteurianum DSM 525 = ATCC 6013]